MSYIFLQAQAAESLAGNCSDTDACAPSSGNLTPRPCLWHDKTMEPSRLSRFGMTCKPLTEDHGAALLTSFVADSRAKTLAWPVKAQALTARAAACGTTWPASLARYDPVTHSLKTAQLSLVEDLTGCCVTLPRSGLMRDGQCWELPTLGRRTSGTESGYWQTPVADDCVNRAAGKINSRGEPKLSAQVMRWTTPSASDATRGGDGRETPNKLGWAVANHMKTYTVERESFAPGQQTPPMRLNPDWVEWLMGWPIGQTALKPLETGRFPEWQQQHSLY